MSERKRRIYSLFPIPYSLKYSADVQFVEDFHDAVQFPDHFLRSLFEEVRRNAAAQDDFSFILWNAMDV